ncbi:diguanylate cyclase (GGDEF) domain-containing protein [Pseudomonas cuatrocienegasensis]|uniref:Diguanylate cyclase (GGDEF) domain-containing protein n=1 Tax=Pseudomonas cuatrocienegasensis TaxID=543360 RepID=A0ABY1B3L6_9PSED|nr:MULTISPECIES: diguanylate cyclase [Pseudomonas]SEP84915.1 diguanylate cyclase (GGDEF) domain-containing protein [Pseudomonas cuatrocienegasensis]
MHVAVRILLLVCLPLLAQAGQLSAPLAGERLLPGPFMQVWEDRSGQAEMPQVRALPASAWQPVARRDASFGYSRSAFWLRLNVHNPAPQAGDWILLVGNPLLDQLDVYGLDDTRVYRAGDQRPFAERWIAHRQLALPLHLQAGETRELLLRMRSEGSANLSASLMSRATFEHHEQRHLLLQGLFFGALAVMVIYNLSIFVITRDRNYLWYSLFVSSFALYQFIQLGFALQWLWPNALAWHQLSFPLSSALATLMAIIFTYGVLDLKHCHRLYSYTCWVLTIAAVLVIGMALIGPYRLALMGSFALLGACSIAAWGVTLLRWRAGYRPARLFALGWSMLIIASLFSILSGTGILPYSLVTLQAQQIGSLVELVIFSIALASRIRESQQAQALAQAQLFDKERQLRQEQERSLSLQRRTNEQLEQRVTERTRELEQAMQALASANQQLNEQNRRDSLTGLLNRMTFNNELDRALARATRSQTSVAILMMDLDFFKQVNDHYGHLAGDACLQHTAWRLEQRLRTGDLLARFGGEEFVALLDHTSAAGAQALAEQLCEDLAAHPCLYDGQSIALSLSIGVCAGIPRSATQRDLYLRRADQALYQAKSAGRNRVERAPAPALNET